MPWIKDEEKKITIHLDSATQDPSVPNHQVEQCPWCGSKDLLDGYGMMGGGIGVWQVCNTCNKLASKVQTE